MGDLSVERKILLNPGPATTTDSVKLAQVVPDICPREAEFCELLRSVRNKLVEVASGGIDYEAVLIPGSGTSGIDACLSSILPEDGAICVVNNGAYGRRMAQICRVYYHADQIEELSLPDDTPPRVDQLEAYLARNPAITHVAIVHHETTTGLLNPIAELAQMCAGRGVAVVIDAMSSFAGIPIDLSLTPYDYLVSSSNKCIQGMAGLSFVIAKTDRLEMLSSLPVRNYSLNLFRQFESLRQSGEMRFTPPVQTVYALNQALDEYFEEGGAQRYARYCESWRCLMNGLESLGLTALLPIETQSKLLTAIREPALPGFDYGALHDRLFERGVTIYPGKGGAVPNFRVANIGAIDRSDIAIFVKLLAEYLSSLRGPGVRGTLGHD